MWIASNFKFILLVFVGLMLHFISTKLALKVRYLIRPKKRDVATQVNFLPIKVSSPLVCSVNYG
jgi:hypothetical protein